VSQLPRLFGFSSNAQGLFDESRAFVEGVANGETVNASLIVGVASLAVILAFRRWLPRVPGILVAVVGSVIATRAFDLTAHGVSVVGRIPSGFPTPTVPDVSLHDTGRLLVAAAGMAFVMLADTTTLSRSLASKRGERVDSDQEIIALGTANLAAGLFSGFPRHAPQSPSRGAHEPSSPVCSVRLRSWSSSSVTGASGSTSRSRHSPRSSSPRH
jgi:MFS superfamily sulfate permease-like transporter